MGYNGQYHEDSDADDEYERSVITSPTLPPDFESSPTDSDAPSTEDTPTNFNSSAYGNTTPTGLITKWSAAQCADFVSSLGLGQYADAFFDEEIGGESLVELQHPDLKELGVSSAGHRVMILKGVYEVKIRQNLPIDPDSYVPLTVSAGASTEAPPTQDDFARIIRIIKERDERIINAEMELRTMREDMNRIFEENKKLREDLLPIVRAAKDRNTPLPTPEDHSSPQVGLDKTTGLSRKWSTKKLFLGSAPKNPSPTTLNPSAAAVAASKHLNASVNGGNQPQSGPSPLPQPSPTSPGYASSVRTYTRQGNYNDHSYAANDRSVTPLPLNSRNVRPGMAKEIEVGDPPLSGGSIASSAIGGGGGGGGGQGTGRSTASIAPSTAGSTNQQVEIFKSLRVSMEDPCHKVLRVAVKKYNIDDDWREYSLYIVHGDQERCVGLNEKPLGLVKQLSAEGRKPMLMLRKHAASATATSAGGGGVGPSGSLTGNTAGTGTITSLQGGGGGTLSSTLGGGLVGSGMAHMSMLDSGQSTLVGGSNLDGRAGGGAGGSIAGQGGMGGTWGGRDELPGGII